ncbi:hypothetical protein AGR8A_Cc70202 [Agrobacterium fabrum str. J-07]|nr:hypothetical protein AGR8A_Cc70202 [Agrobacterium fabrum str. J-07]
MPSPLPRPPKTHCLRISAASSDSFCWNICAGRSKAQKKQNNVYGPKLLRSFRELLYRSGGHALADSRQARALFPAMCDARIFRLFAGSRQT